MNNKESIFKNNVSAKRSKSFLGALANIGMVLVVSGLLFAVFKLIGDNFPSVKHDQEESILVEQKYRSESIRAGVLFVEGGKNVDDDIIIERSIINEVKTSLIHHNLQSEYENFSSYKSSDIVDIDNLKNSATLYYFCDYKIKNSNFYDENPAELNYFSKYYDEQLFKNSELNYYDLAETNTLRYFTKENSKELGDYYFKKDTYKSNQLLVDNLVKSFSKTFKLMRDDFSKNNSYAKKLIRDHKNAYGKYADSLVFELLAAYFLATFLTYMVPYFIKKDYGSIGDMLTKTPIARKDGKQMNIFNSLGIFLINLLANFYTLFLLILFIYANPGLAIHNVGIFNIFVPSIIGFIFSVCSLILMLFIKNHQFIDTLSMLLERKERDVVVVTMKEEIKYDK